MHIQSTYTRLASGYAYGSEACGASSRLQQLYLYSIHHIDDILAPSAVVLYMFISCVKLNVKFSLIALFLTEAKAASNDICMQRIRLFGLGHMAVSSCPASKHMSLFRSKRDGGN